jgi:hypothetical protein
MRRALKIIGRCVVIPATLLALFMMLSWSKRHLDWFVPVKGARLTVDGFANRRMSLFRAISALFALPPTGTMVLIQSINGKKETYVILGPGPGHLPEGFKGSVRRCESAFVATSLFGFADDYSECATPAPNRDSNRDAKFDARFVEFTSDDGKRLRAEW